MLVMKTCGIKFLSDSRGYKHREGISRGEIRHEYSWVSLRDDENV